MAVCGPYVQGMTEADRDRLDGYRDTVSVLTGATEPRDLARAEDQVTDAYRAGVARALEECAEDTEILR